MRIKLPASIEREVDRSRDEFVELRSKAQEAADALTAGRILHVSNTRESDLRELVLYCDAQIQRIDQGLAPLGAMQYLEAIIRVLAGSGSEP